MRKCYADMTLVVPLLGDILRTSCETSDEPLLTGGVGRTSRDMDLSGLGQTWLVDGLFAEAMLTVLRKDRKVLKA